MRTFRRSMHYFEVVARTRSIRLAGEALHIAPSAVSRTVQQLEEEVGVPLFERTAKGLYLTVAGETILSYMRRWKRESEQLALDVQSLAGVRLETVRVATVEVASYVLLPQAIAAVRGRVPGLSVDVVVGDTQAVLESVLNGSAEIGLVINIPRNGPVHSMWTMHDPLGLVVPRHHALAERQSVTFADCVDEPLILPSEPLIARQALRSLLEPASKYRVAATANRIIAVKSLLRAGLGITFLTRLDVSAEVAAGEFRHVPLVDRGIQHPYLSVVSARNQRRTPTTDLLIETLRKGMPSEEFRA